MQDFQKLTVWEKSHRLTLDIYRATTRFPADERFGVTSQMRRCSASIPANIAEGCGRGGNREFARFLRNAAGSASELQYHLILSRDLGFPCRDDFDRLEAHVTEIKRMLAGLTRTVKATASD